MRLRLKLVSIHFIVLLMLSVSFVVYVPKEAYGSTTNLEGLGDISRYNAVVFGNHKAIGGDIEGAIAVQGDMDASGYTIVGAAAGTSNIVGEKWVDEGYPSLLLSGKFKKSREESFIIQNGIVVMTKESDPDRIIQSSYDRIVYKEKLEIDAKFNEFRNIVNQVSKNAGQYKTNTPIPNMSHGIGKDINNPNIYVSSELTGKINLDIRDVFLPNAKDKDFIVMYSDAIEVTFKNGAILYDTNNVGKATDIVPTSQPYSPNSPFTELYGKMIWVFPNAKKITTEGYGVVGSVFAPNAVLETKGGSINGQAFVGAVQQTGGFEFHNFKFNWQHWNKPSTGKVKIKKVDSNNDNKKLVGAKFHIEDSKGKIVGELVTNEEGEVISKDLPIGNYTLVEVEAPKGYELLKDKITVKIEKDAVVEIKIGNKKLPDPMGKMKLVKVDISDKNKKLAGAKFKIEDLNGRIVGELVTNEEGEVISKDLPIGNYTLVEVEAPKGYELLKDKITVKIEKDAVAEIKIGNKKLPDPMGKMKLVKVDMGDKNKKLAGAKFHIEDSNKKVVGELVTDEKGEVISKDLPIGNYTLVEIEAPKGYELLKDKIAVKIEKDTVVEIKIGNKKLPDPTGQFEIEKVDDKDSELKLKGAVFQVLDKEGKEVSRLITNEKGKVISNQLAIGKYTIKEIKAPNGYMLLRDPIEIEITEAVKTQKITVKNAKNNWVIPNTGGSGTTIFYVIGIMLMFAVLYFCKKNRIL
ncbi:MULTISPECIES: SpaA isopeptide-forming pilin-related protein [Bacillus cereus group]|uniref:SpaA isopeptide-forming pilin-related protein n=1 Tax=Bacillus cereus group TaxID=86661 RepID=UPI001298CE16|nr:MULTISPECIES: SpaA isopeptide-forming pilin-related protein [Bacillus cereus group]MCR6787472.1 SpaA isopeptide-forming pilin-related protein [Bacillus thuringiensis]MCR6822843.1 SpaA isopeptide-forming pilin-related protein [Bacillus thuringiensis]MCR6829548.1 SpaA isopeptide-forming pilin-related protein [Bacillus thuringiensis]MEB9327890.1 SpaA isopeptide-forming pilin-related protein [Bacillus cereus]MEC3209766.1 SpaA isopeptide-forming pilin-related protein [Bacillus cereus]